MRNLILSSLTAFLLAGMPFAAGAPATDLSSKYRHWLDDEVVYIIADREREDFLALGSDREREEFIRRFWQLRDPDPSTEESEYKKEHYRRIRYAKQHFHDGRPGWKTDRGRVYIIHGQPDDIRFTFGGSPLRIEIQNPTQVLTGGGTDRRRFFRVEFIRPQTEIWVYRHLSGARNFSSYFQVIFSRIDPTQLHMLHETIRKAGSGANQSFPARYARDSAIMNFQRGQRIGGRYRIVYAGQFAFSEIDDFYESVFHPSRPPAFSLTDFHLALRDLEQSPGNILYRRLLMKHNLKESVRSRVFFKQFPLHLFFSSIRGESGSTMLPVTLGINPEYEGDTLELVLELMREDGSSAASVMDSVKVEPRNNLAVAGRGTDDFLYQARLAARPGEYKLVVFARLKDRGAVAHLEQDVHLPDYLIDRLSMSDVLLFDEVLPRKALHWMRKGGSRDRFLGAGSPLILKDFLLIPASDSNFRRKEKLTAFVEVYNPGSGDDEMEAALELRCRIWDGQRLIGQIPGRRLDYVTDSGRPAAEGRRTAYGLTIPLRSLKPGHYSFELEVQDHINNQQVSKRRAFTIY